jgi:hypothetical protein
MKKFIHKLQQKADPATSKPMPDHTASDLVQQTFDYFYSKANSQFQARAKSESTLGENDHFGYVVWPVIIMVQASFECIPQSNSHALRDGISSLQTYWNPGRHGFCAWKMFPGNEDIYYDDNAHACQALITAFENTRDRKYLDQAKEILTLLIMPAAEKDGGVPWHTNNQNCRNACSTGPAAVSALRIHKLQGDQNLVGFAERALQWMVDNLRDPEDGLIWDSLIIEPHGKRNINKMKWTYNTGFAIHGFALLYEVTRKQEYLDTAVKFAEAAMNRDGALFDRSISNPEQRMYSDASFFLHHLVDGYQALAKHVSRDRLTLETRHIAEWGRTWMFDPIDGLYFRGSCPYTISEELTKRFNEKFGLQKRLEINGQERDEKGNLCKTLIGNASWARMLHVAENL